ncbi:MAG: hypothetical protein ACI83N_000748 [Hydrogenophaga sp.]|jgi:hypothetical protein
MHTPHPSPNPIPATAHRGPMTLLSQARWRLGVLTELAQPGHMALAPVLDDGGEVIDFTWRQASPTSTLALGCAGEDLVGCKLTQVLGKCAIDASVFDSYRAVFLQQQAQTLRVEGKDGVTVHCISPLPAGLNVEVSSVAAMDRMLAAQQAMRERE